MIYKRRRVRSSAPGGYYRFESGNGRGMFGSGDSDFIRLRDEFGNEWRGSAEQQPDNTVRYRFRDSYGNIISGISDREGIILRDEHGNVWRGFLD